LIRNAISRNWPALEKRLIVPSFNYISQSIEYRRKLKDSKNLSAHLLLAFFLFYCVMFAQYQHKCITFEIDDTVGYFSTHANTNLERAALRIRNSSTQLHNIIIISQIVCDQLIKEFNVVANCSITVKFIWCRTPYNWMHLNW
jgi:hypothetical protein